MNNVIANNKNRIGWIDLSKGFTIIFVIIGHSSINGLLRGIIFSFHMPLFFILSCMTFRLSINNDEFVKKTEKAFIHLFLPAVGIYFFRTVISVIKNLPILTNYDLHSLKSYFANIVNVFVVGSGVTTFIGESQIAAIGIPWFLMALFFGRSLFDYLQLKFYKKKFYISIALCSIIGFCFGLLQWLPFSFDIALTIQPLFLYGQWLKNFDIKKHAVKTCVISLGLWAGLFAVIYLISGSYMELACRRYAVYPLCFLCAIGGTMFFSSFSQLFLNLKNISKPIIYLGRNSLILLWVHCFDKYYAFAYNLTSNGNINAIIRVTEDVIVFVVVMILISRVKKKKMSMH